MSASDLPPVGSNGALLKEPVRVLDRRMTKQENHVVTEVLAERADTFPEDSSWEKLHDLQRRFLAFETKRSSILFQGKGI